jgi:hypothetical protein
LELKLVENWTFLVLFMCELEPKQTFWKKKNFEKRKTKKTRTKGWSKVKQQFLIWSGLPKTGLEPGLIFRTGSGI